MDSERTPSGGTVSQVILSNGDPLEAKIVTSWYRRDGTNDHRREGAYVHMVEDREDRCFGDVRSSSEWETICEGVLLRCIPDPRSSDPSAWELRVRRDVAPIYVHMLRIEEYYCDDASWDDNINESRKYAYAIKVDAGVGTGAGETSV